MFRSPPHAAREILQRLRKLARLAYSLPFAAEENDGETHEE